MPIRRTSVLSLLSLRKLQENQDLISCRQSEREVGGRMEVGLVERWALGVIRKAMEIYVKFTDDLAKRK